MVYSLDDGKLAETFSYNELLVYYVKLISGNYKFCTEILNKNTT